MDMDESTIIIIAQHPLARELGQPLLVGLDGLEFFLPLEVLLGRDEKKRHLATLGARPADVLLGTLALAPRAEAFWFVVGSTHTQTDRHAHKGVVWSVPVPAGKGGSPEKLE